jgi:UDP-N-acetylglucosamine--N-acetylmuramyl-(pentapeptide) pyrophosphoryl-undecaprenol N-acetylglucosamine transferase
MPDAQILFIGAVGRMEAELIPREGFELQTLRVSNLQRRLSREAFRHNLRAAADLAHSLGEASRIVRDFRPDVAVGTGGYVCYPVLRAAAARHIPTALHESNAVPGLTTRLLQSRVDRIMVGFEDSRVQYKKPEKVVVTGTPVRGSFRSADQAAAKREIGLPADKPLLLSVWGSLGSDHMNEVMVRFIQLLCRQPAFSLIHSTGGRGYAAMLERLRDEGVVSWERSGIEVREYIYDMPRVMAAADLVICRAGASTLSELTILGKPAILVPSPNVTKNHQERNARMLERAGAAQVLLEGEFSAESLLGSVSELFRNREELGSMAAASTALSVPDATDRIVELILGLAG